jgi:hypothetical protein
MFYHADFNMDVFIQIREPKADGEASSSESESSESESDSDDEVEVGNSVSKNFAFY